MNQNTFTTQQVTEPKMIIDKKYKLEKAVKSGPNRVGNYFQDSTNTPFLDGNHAVATSGHVLAIVPVERAGTDSNGMIPVAALKGSRKRTEGGLIALGEDTAKLSESEYSRDPFGPVSLQWRKVLPEGAPEYSITLNPKKLHDLAQALGCGKEDTVTLYFYGDRSAVGVCPVSDQDAYGVIMPAKGHGTGKTPNEREQQRNALAAHSYPEPGDDNETIG